MDRSYATGTALFALRPRRLKNVDDELVGRAKVSIALEHGLRESDAPRLVGSSAAELHADAKAMAKELGAFDPSERTRDDLGRFTDPEGEVDVNAMIRAAAGR
jgi:hypothetical protein